jgi:RecB family exonuclease
VEGVFPDLRLRESLLGVRHLSPSLPGEAGAYARFRLQEEMRLAYTAMGRARRRVVWTCTAAGFEEGRGLPSRFLALVAGVPTVAEAAHPPAEAADPSTPLEAEAWLRRLLADPGQPSSRRLAALDALVGPGAWRARPPEDFAGMLERGPDHGLIPAGLALSPSQADSYLQCPRRYAFERWLHVGDEGSVYASLGSLIHQVLETVEGEALAAGEAHGTIDDALAALAGHWDPVPFGGGGWAAAWRRRGEEVLRHLYERWPSAGRVKAVEHDLAVEVDGIRWRGRADRIEVRPADPPAVHIVDYKTARTAPKAEEAAASLQLGFYLLAAEQDPVIGSFGRVTGAEMWFPAAPRKSVTVRPFDPGRRDEVRGLMAEAADGIRAERWGPTPGDHCRNCAVRRVCPEWPEGREAYLAWP